MNYSESTWKRWRLYGKLPDGWTLEEGDGCAAPRGAWEATVIRGATDMGTDTPKPRPAKLPRGSTSPIFKLRPLRPGQGVTRADETFSVMSAALVSLQVPWAMTAEQETQESQKIARAAFSRWASTHGARVQSVLVRGSIPVANVVKVWQDELLVCADNRSALRNSIRALVDWFQTTWEQQAHAGLWKLA